MRRLSWSNRWTLLFSILKLELRNSLKKEDRLFHQLEKGYVWWSRLRVGCGSVTKSCSIYYFTFRFRLVTMTRKLSFQFSRQGHILVLMHPFNITLQMKWLFLTWRKFRTILRLFNLICFSVEWSKSLFFSQVLFKIRAWFPRKRKSVPQAEIKIVL